MYLKVEISDYLEYLKLRNYSLKTIKLRKGILLNYSDLFTDIELYSINKYFHAIKHLKSVNTYLSTLRNFVKHLEGEGKVPAGHSSKIELQRQVKPLPKIIYRPEELIWIIDSIPETSEDHIRHKAMFYLLYGTGMRIGEAIGLHSNYINFSRSTVHIIKGKGNKNRVVPMPQKVSSYLNDYLRIKKYPSVFVFSDLGNKLSASSIYQALSYYFPDGFTYHDFRHHCAVHLLENGVSIRYIQSLLGHEDIRTTTIYTKIHNDLLKRNYRKSHPLQHLEKPDDTS